MLAIFYAKNWHRNIVIVIVIIRVRVLCFESALRQSSEEFVNFENYYSKWWFHLGSNNNKCACFNLYIAVKLELVGKIVFTITIGPTQINEVKSNLLDTASSFFYDVWRTNAEAIVRWKLDTVINIKWYIAYRYMTRFFSIYVLACHV